MALGLCPLCDKLVSIQGRTPKIPGKYPRMLDWYPVVHETKEGKECLGHTRAIV